MGQIITLQEQDGNQKHEISYLDLLHEDCLPEYNGISHWKNKSLDNLPGEIWKSITKFEGKYEASNLGRIKSLSREIKRSIGSFTSKTKILSQNLSQINDEGYLKVHLTENSISESYYVHIIIGEVFIINYDNKKTINHKKGNKKDNRVTMLEWNTYSENHEHSYRELGRKSHMAGKIGKLHPNSKKIICLNTGQIFDSLKDAGDQLKIPFQNISKVCYGQRPRAKGLSFKFLDA